MTNKEISPVWSIYIEDNKDAVCKSFTGIWTTEIVNNEEPELFFEVEIQYIKKIKKFLRKSQLKTIKVKKLISEDRINIACIYINNEDPKKIYGNVVTIVNKW